MTKLIAIINVIAWAGFWAFGYIALTSDDLTSGQLTIAAILAFAGLVMGVLAYHETGARLGGERICQRVQPTGRRDPEPGAGRMGKVRHVLS